MNIPIRRRTTQPVADADRISRVRVQVDPGVVLGYVCLTDPQWGIYCGLYVATCGCGKPGGEILVQRAESPATQGHTFMLAHAGCLRPLEG